MQSRLCGMLASCMSRRGFGRRESVVDISIDVGLRRILGDGSPGRLLGPWVSNQTIAIVWAHAFPIRAVAKTVPICSSVLLCSRACGSRGSVLQGTCSSPCFRGEVGIARDIERAASILAFALQWSALQESSGGYKSIEELVQVNFVGLGPSNGVRLNAFPSPRLKINSGCFCSMRPFY